jgi:hypothetical protein
MNALWQIAVYIACLASAAVAVCSLAIGQELSIKGTVDASTLATKADLEAASQEALGDACALRVLIDRRGRVACVTGDRTFDNGPLINFELAKLEGEVDLPAGAIYTQTTIVMPRRTGISLRGQGATIALPPNSFDLANPACTGGPATRIIYIGPADKPAIKFLGCMGRLDQLTIQRGDCTNPPAPMPRDGSVGLQIGGSVGLNTGKLLCPQLSIIGFDTAINVVATSDNESSDQNVFGQLWIEHCWTGFKCNAKQSVANHFQDITFGGYGDTVFDIQQGGKNIVDNLSLNNRALVLKWKEPQHNTASFDLRWLCVDNNAAGWRLIDVDKAWGLNFSVRGEIGNRATPGANPVSIKGGKPENHEISIEIWDGSTYRPWAWEVAK